MYKARYDREEAPSEPVVAEDKIADQVGNDAPAVEPAKVLYGVQVLVSSKDMPASDPFFAGYKPTKLAAGKYFKYVIEVSTSLSAVKKKYSSVQKKFPDSYIVKIEDGTTSPVK